MERDKLHESVATEHEQKLNFEKDFKLFKDEISYLSNRVNCKYKFALNQFDLKHEIK